MPRSSRHKSSKYSSRDGRDYSDSEKELTSKDKKGKEESSVRVSKELGSSEKRKLSSHDGNGEFSEEYSGASKRRIDRVEDGVNDRWNGGDDDRGEGSQKSKVLSDSKSKGSRRHDDVNARRDESVGMHGEDEEVKNSSNKVDERHKLERGSSRKEGKEGVSDKEKKAKEGKSERLADNVIRVEALGSASTRKQGSKSEAFEEECRVKQAAENTELNIQDELKKREPESQIERRNRRRDGSGDGDNHQDDIRDINGRRLSSRDVVTKDEKYNDERHKEERYRDKYLEDTDRESKHRNDKQRDERTARDRTGSRSDDKHSRDEKYSAEIRHKKSRPLEGVRDRDRSRDRDRNQDRDRSRDRDRERDRERERDRDGDRVRDRDLNHDHDRDHDRDRDHDHIRDRDRDHDHNHSSHFDDRSTRFKENRGRNRSPDDHNDTKSRGARNYNFDTEKNSLSGSKVESDADRGRSQSRQAHLDATVSANRRRTSPSDSSHGGMDGYRHSKQEDWKYRDPLSEQRPHATSSALEKVSKYRSMEKPIRMDNKYMGDFSAERSPSSKASPMGFMERSPSSTSIDRRLMNRSGVRQSLDLDETGRRSSGSNDARDSSANEDRLSRDLPSEKPLVDESSQADSSFYNRTNQSNSSSLIPTLPAFRAGIDSPFSGLLEEDSRPNSSTRYKVSGDPNAGRGHANSWKGVPNWSSPLPNAFIPFQHGPPHGGFPAMMPQFTSPPMFGVRPSLEMNHPGVPYHIPDADRFPSHLRSFGWQNTVDGSGPHGWDGNTGAFREEPHMYRGPDWDHNRHSMNARGWEMSADMWKRQNGDLNMDLPSTSHKEDYPVRAAADDVLVEQTGHGSQNEGDHHGVQAKNMEIMSSGTSPAIETSNSPPNAAHDKTTDPSKISSDDSAPHVCHVYLSKLDISTELASSELYNECMTLFNMDQCTTIDEAITKHVILEDGAIAGARTPNASLSPLFPTLKDSIFQRAMDLYKKQSTEIRVMPSSNREKLDIVSASVQEKVEEHVPVLDMENSEEAVPSSDQEMPVEPKEAVPTSDQEMPREPILNYSPKRAELVLSGDQENLEVVVPILNQEVQKQDLTPSPEKSESPVHDQICENSEEPLPSLDRMTIKPEKLGDADENCFPSLQNSSQTATILLTNSDDLKSVVKTEGYHSCYSAEDRQALGDTMSNPLFFSGGSQGSNESELVIYSRIHHSPESTH